MMRFCPANLFPYLPCSWYFPHLSFYVSQMASLVIQINLTQILKRKINICFLCKVEATQIMNMLENKPFNVCDDTNLRVLRI